jgi:gas vesicle protein
MNDSINTAKHAVDNAKDGVEHAYVAAKDGVDHAYSTAKGGGARAFATTMSTLMTGVQGITSLASALRSLDRDDALSWIGLARRRGPFESIAIFGAGFVAGAGAGMLLAPTSGAELRKTLWGRVMSMKGEATEQAKKIEGDAERAVHDAGAAVKDVTHRAVDQADSMKQKAGQAAQSAVGSGLHTVGSAVKQAGEDVKNVGDQLRPPANHRN